MQPVVETLPLTTPGRVAETGLHRLFPPNDAVTVRACDIVTWHVVVPEHAPDQPEKVCPVAGVAVSVSDVPLAKLPVQFPPAVPAVIVQLILPVVEVTVPLPVPPPATVRANV